MTRTDESPRTSMTTAEIRSTFLDFFASKGHRVAPSAPLVPWQDPTLLFVNAGMVPFKDVFTGAARAESPRAASSQRCLRVSGKHNDLEEVGRTPRHHTLFEMLGNFSFGDYFKERAIELAWELLVDRLKLDPARLAISVFGGEKGVGADDEAAELWRRISGLPSERILRFGWKDNFWTMGETGPCGPCSEIHYDLGADLPGTVNDGARWMEIWNLVFMQYERDASGTLTPLPAPSIDTGMGLERISSVVQGKRSNYETDLFVQLLARISAAAGRTYDGGPGDDAVSMRVIADHARAVAFLLADGVAPDRVGRGYVLRKILRRAVSHGVLLGVTRPFMAEIAEGVVDLMGDAHPVLKERRADVRRGCEQEEALYRRTVEEGMRRIDDLLNQLQDETIWLRGEQGERVLKGDVAFRLYDTYGCPLELTASVGVRRGFSVDEAGFQAAMEVQKERSREHWRGAGAGKGAADAFVASNANAPADALHRLRGAGDGVGRGAACGGARRCARSRGSRRGRRAGRDRDRGDAVLRRVGRTDRRRRRDRGGGRAHRRGRRAQVSWRRDLPAFRHRRSGGDRARESRAARRGCGAPAGDRRASFGDASRASCTSRSAGIARAAKGLVRGAGAPALRLLAHPGGVFHGPGRDRRARERAGARRTSWWMCRRCRSPRPRRRARSRSSATSTATSCALCPWGRRRSCAAGRT